MAKNKNTGKQGIERTPTGIYNLDRLSAGGFVRDSTVLIRGDTGTGKTIFCLQYLYKGATEYNEPGVYISFSESINAIRKHGLAFGWELGKLMDKNKLMVLRYEPHEIVNIMEQGGGSLRDSVESIGAKRIVIDSLTAYQMVFETPYQANKSILGLFEMLNKWDATTLVTSEFPVTLEHESGGRLGFLTDGIINFYNIRKKTERVRALEILKMRDTEHDNKIHFFSIGKNGITLNRRSR